MRGILKFVETEATPFVQRLEPSLKKFVEEAKKIDGLKDVVADGENKFLEWKGEVGPKLEIVKQFIASEAAQEERGVEHEENHERVEEILDIQDEPQQPDEIPHAALDNQGIEVVDELALPPGVPTIAFHHLSNISVLPQANGVVYRGKYCNTDIALKVLRGNVERFADLRAEAEHLARLRHPRILILLGVVTDLPDLSGGLMGLVTEYMPRGDLYTVLHRNASAFRFQHLSEKVYVLKDVADGMRYLHANNMIHGDVKSPNVLIDNEGHAKICDFGISRSLSTHTTHVTSLGGTAPWSAPEVLAAGNGGIRQACDVYSFGVILWEMLTGREPWDGLNGMEIAIRVSRGEQLEIPPSSDNCPEVLVLVLEQCLQRIPDDRPVFTIIYDVLVDELIKCRRAERRNGIPNEFMCPILGEIMEDPVVCADGHTYDHVGIERWLHDHDTSPATNIPLPNKILLRNHALRKLISDYVTALNNET